MSQVLDFRQDIEMNGNSINNVRVNPILSGDPVPMSGYGMIASYSGVAGPAYTVFTEGEGVYFNDGTNWVKLFDVSDSSVMADPDTLVMRDASGQVSVPLVPTNPNDGVSYDYLSNNISSGVRIAGSIDPSGPTPSLPQPLATSYTGGTQTNDGTLNPGPGIAKGDGFYVVNSTANIGPTMIPVQPGDFIIALNDITGAPTPSDFIIINRNETNATNAIYGVTRLATPAEIDTVASATAATDVAITPADITTMFADADFRATTSMYGVGKLAMNSAVATRAAASANNDMLTPSVLAEAFTTLKATTLDAGTVNLAETGTDFPTRSAASMNTIDAVTPAQIDYVMANWNADEVNAGTVKLAESLDVANRTALAANTIDAMTPELTGEMFMNITATSAELGTVYKYDSPMVGSVPAIVAEDDVYITPYAAAEILEVTMASVVHKETVSGTGGTFTISNIDTTKIIDIQAFDNTLNKPVYIGTSFANSGPNVDITWTSSPAINGVINVIMSFTA